MDYDIQKCGVKPYSNDISLYIHIPFCKSKCSYCNFCSFADKNDKIEQYLDALCKEIEYRAKELDCVNIQSIYIGGGTPSVLPEGSVTKIMQTVKKSFALKTDLSITIEVNPNSINKTKLSEYINNGINRLSIGLQSSDSSLLKLLNRPHTTQDFLNAINEAKSVGFKNISADMIIGIPTQTLKNVEETLDLLLSQDLQHISAYGLILEPNTPLYKQVKGGLLKQIDDDIQNLMYDTVLNKLKQAGFNRYEISNFSKPGFQSFHNLNYWRRGQYLGVGLDAYSFVHGLHWQNTDNLEDYLKDYTRKCNQENETIYTAKLETIMLGLRLDEGLDIDKFNKDFDTDFLKEYSYVLENLLNNKLVKIENGHLIICDMHISNSIISEFA